MKIETVLENCINTADNLGEFIVKGHKIRVFRSESTGSVCGFIDTIYWTQWITADDEDMTRNMKDCMYELLEYIVKNFYNNMVSVEMVADIYTADNPIINRHEIADDLKQFLEDEFNIKNFTFKINHRDDTIGVRFFGTYNIIYYYILHNNNSVLYRKTFLNGEMHMIDPDLKKFITEGFNFKVSWY